MNSAKSRLSPIFSDPAALKWFDALPGETFNIRVDSQLSDFGFSIAEAIIQPNAGPPLHIHHDAHEVLYVVDGVVDFVCEGQRFQSGPGGLVVIPKGAKHAFRNFGSKPARLLGVLSPGGLEQLFKRMEGLPVSEIQVFGPEYHLEIVGPPLDEPLSGKSIHENA